MIQLAHLGSHGGLNFTQGIESHYHCMEHCQQVSKPIETLGIPLVTIIADEPENFVLPSKFISCLYTGYLKECVLLSMINI